MDGPWCRCVLGNWQLNFGACFGASWRFCFYPLADGLCQRAVVVGRHLRWQLANATTRQTVAVGSIRYHRHFDWRHRTFCFDEPLRAAPRRGVICDPCVIFGGAGLSVFGRDHLGLDADWFRFIGQRRDERYFVWQTCCRTTSLGNQQPSTGDWHWIRFAVGFMPSGIDADAETFDGNRYRRHCRVSSADDHSARLPFSLALVGF